MGGLSDKEKKERLRLLAFGENMRDQAESISPERKAYSYIFSSCTEDFTHALAEKDYDKLFDLEEIAQENDLNFRSSNIEKSLKFTGELDGLRKRFKDFQNPENVIKEFSPTIERLNRQDERMIDGTFKRDVESLCRFLHSQKSPRCVPSENTFYSIRAKAIKEIQNERQRNVDFTLGYDKGKEQSKDLGR